RKRFAFCLGVRAFVRQTIRETLALDAKKGLRRTFPIVYAELGAVVVAEIEFRQKALQMLLRNVVIRPVDPALEDREIALDCVRMHVAANVLANAVIDRVVLL